MAIFVKEKKSWFTKIMGKLLIYIDVYMSVYIRNEGNMAIFVKEKNHELRKLWVIDLHSISWKYES